MKECEAEYENEKEIKMHKKRDPFHDKGAKWRFFKFLNEKFMKKMKNL